MCVFFFSIIMEEDLKPCLTFQEKFQKKYGCTRLQFQTCSLTQALERSCFTNINDVSICFRGIHNNSSHDISSLRQCITSSIYHIDELFIYITRSFMHIQNCLQING